MTNTHKIYGFTIWCLAEHLSLLDMISLRHVNKDMNNRIKTNKIWNRLLKLHFNSNISTNTPYEDYVYYFKNMILPHNYKYQLSIYFRGSMHTRNLLRHRFEDQYNICSIRDMDFNFIQEIDLDDIDNDVMNLPLYISLYACNTNSRKILVDHFKIDLYFDIYNLSYTTQLFTIDKLSNMTLSFRTIMRYKNNSNYFELDFPNILCNYNNFTCLLLKA